MKKEKNIINIFKTKKYIKENKKAKYYPYSGIETYLGRMGGGKTISAVKRIREIIKEYPEITFITNVKINDIEPKEIIYFKNCEELIEILRNKLTIENNKGYLIFIDEIHVVLSELFGKTDPTFLQYLSQQRKLSIHIIGTSQMFNYLPKFIRKYLLQSGKIIICNNYLNVIQINKEVEMESIKENSDGTFTYEKAKMTWYIHTKELYESYDTYAVISQIQGLIKNGTYKEIKGDE